MEFKNNLELTPEKMCCMKDDNLRSSCLKISRIHEGLGLFTLTSYKLHLPRGNSFVVGLGNYHVKHKPFKYILWCGLLL